MQHDIQVSFDSLSGVSRLAEGTGNWCFSGTLRGNNVVIKYLKDEASEIDAQDLERELGILRVIQHPNIVKLVGAGLKPQGGIFLLLEHLSRGTLDAKLGTNTPGGSSWVWRTRVRSWFPRKEALRQAAGVASALAYLHDEAVPGAKVVHRDIKSSNLVFATDGTLKLIDFGLCKVLRSCDRVGDNLYKMTGDTGSLRYMPPEVAQGLLANESADTYSFAMVVWEMVMLEQPFHSYPRDLFWKQVIMGDVHPRLPKKWPAELRKILLGCWSRDITARPTMANVASTLRNIQ